MEFNVCPRLVSNMRSDLPFEKSDALTLYLSSMLILTDRVISSIVGAVIESHDNIVEPLFTIL
jgi:hypothetical protein